MAKKKSADGINRSEAIRQYALEHSGARPKEIAEALTAQLGVPITNAQVSTVLFNERKKTGKRRRRGAGGRRGVAAAQVTESAVDFVKAAGGFAAARAAIDELERIAGLLK